MAAFISLEMAIKKISKKSRVPEEAVISHNACTVSQICTALCQKVHVKSNKPPFLCHTQLDHENLWGT